MFTSSFRYIRFCSCHGQGKQKQSTKHTKKNLKKNKRRLVTNEVRTRSERGTKRGQKLPGTDPYPNVWILANADRQRTSKKKSTAWHTLIQEQKQHTWLTQNVWTWYTRIYHFTYYFMLFYHIWTLPILTNIYVAKKKATHGRHTSKHRNNIHNLSNMLYYDAPQYAFPARQTLIRYDLTHDART